MEMNYCRRCGSELTPGDEGFRCSNGHTIFTNPVPTANLFLVKPDGRTLLLSRRGIEPRKGELDAFGGFLHIDENIEEGLEREMLEETGLTSNNYSHPEYLCSYNADYPFAGEERRLVGTCYVATIRDGVQPVANDDVAEIVEIDIDDVNADAITAPDIHAGMLLLKDRLKEAA